MLRLLKYDLKRDLFTLLGGAMTLIVALLVIEIGGRQIGLGLDGAAVLSLVTYTVFALLILMGACNAFRLNIRSIGRRLIPLGSLQYVGASLLYALLLNAVMLAVGGLQILYYNANGTLEKLIQVGIVKIEWYSPLPLPIGIAFILLWGSLFLQTMLLLVMAAMESLKVKGRSLIALGMVLVLSSLISAAENSFFGGLGSSPLTGFRADNQSSITMPGSESAAGISVYLFELVLIVLFVWGTARMIDRKVRIE